MAKGKWGNRTFTEAFCTGKIGRKKEYGNLYIVQGPYANLLMYRTPKTSEKVLAIKPHDMFAVFTSHYIDEAMPAYAISKLVPTLHIETDTFKDYDLTKFRLVTLKKTQFNLSTEETQGVEIAHSALIDIEGGRWLADFNLARKEGLSLQSFKDYYVDCTKPVDSQSPEKSSYMPYYRELYKVNGEIESVESARASLVPEGTEPTALYNNKWFVPTEQDFSFEDLNEDDLEILSNPPNRFKYGLSSEYDNIAAISVAMEASLKRVHSDSKQALINYIEEYRAHEAALSRAKDRKEIPGILKNIKITSNFKCKGGVHKDEDGNVYVRGVLYDTGDRSFYGDDNVVLSCSLDLKKTTKVIELQAWHSIVPLEFT